MIVAGVFSFFIFTFSVGVMDSPQRPPLMRSTVRPLFLKWNQSVAEPELWKTTCILYFWETNFRHFHVFWADPPSSSNEMWGFLPLFGMFRIKVYLAWSSRGFGCLVRQSRDDFFVFKISMEFTLSLMRTPFQRKPPNFRSIDLESLFSQHWIDFSSQQTDSFWVPRSVSVHWTSDFVFSFFSWVVLNTKLTSIDWHGNETPSVNQNILFLAHHHSFSEIACHCGAKIDGKVQGVNFDVFRCAVFSSQAEGRPSFHDHWYWLFSIEIVLFTLFALFFVTLPFRWMIFAAGAIPETKGNGDDKTTGEQLFLCWSARFCCEKKD